TFSFIDQSTGNPTQWKWDLGNGAISSLKNPSATYFNPGTYTIRLVVKNAAGADSLVKTNFITVHANPTVAFGASDTSGCMPMGVQFTDSSLAGSGTISSWQWDFGDGTISSQQHPQHTYNAAGNYTVTLKVTNSKGCSKSISKQQFIDVSAGVDASFSYSSPNICSAPAAVQFSNTTAGTGNMSYLWNFGDGHTSTDADPVHTYTANGAYTVTLIATSSQGCVDSFQMQNLSIGTQQADFVSPVTACIGEAVNFTNNSSPLPLNSKWIFSDGTVITSLHAVKTFQAAGTYTIKLVSNFTKTHHTCAGVKTGVCFRARLANRFPKRIPGRSKYL
ncbi:MAG: PKD domain-containing protein, partial [Sphingobacteriales bacterium]